MFEAFSRRVLFNLTKQFFKADYAEKDPVFLHWKRIMEQRGFQGNWSSSCKSDAHEKDLELPLFVRYGFFEKQFGLQLLQELDKQGIFEKTPYCSQDFKNLLFSPENPFNTCSEIAWFKHLIENTLTPFRLKPGL